MTRIPTGDRGDMVLGWLVKIALTLGVLGFALFDGISLGTARFTAEDRATQAARAAADAFRDSKGDSQAAYDAAVAEVAKHGDTIDPSTVSFGADGAVTLTLQHDASTLVLHRFGPTEDWTTMSATVTSRPVS